MSEAVTTDGVTRRPAFWIAFVALSATCAALAWEYFPQALPLIHLDVKMSRDQALEEAARIAERLHLADSDERYEGTLAHDSGTQNLVQLGAGGKRAFTRVLAR